MHKGAAHINRTSRDGGGFVLGPIASRAFKAAAAPHVLTLEAVGGASRAWLKTVTLKVLRATLDAGGGDSCPFLVLRLLGLGLQLGLRLLIWTRPGGGRGRGNG